MVSAALLPSGIRIHKKSPKTVTSYGGQHRSGQGLTGCHQSLSLCPCFFIPSPIPLASPRDAHLATRPPYYPTGTIVLLPVPLQLIRVSLASLPSTCGPCLFQKHPPRRKRNTFTKENAQRNSEGRNNDQ